MGYLGNEQGPTGTMNNRRYNVIVSDATQSSFTISGGYAINQIDVYRNGVKLAVDRDFTASNGTSVILVEAANQNDVVQFVISDNYDVADALPTSGGTVNGDVTITGAVTIGSTLTATTNDLNVAYAITAGIASDCTQADFATEAYSAGLSTHLMGSMGVGITGYNLNLTALSTAAQFLGNISGVAGTFSGNVTVGGTLTYDDVTNVDSIGLITARNGLQVLAGITTLTGQLKVNDDAAFAGTYLTVTSALDSRQLRVASVAEQMIRVSAAGSVGIATYNGGGSGNVIYFDAPNGDAVIKLTGVPTDSSFDNQSIVVSAILRTTGTGRSVHPYLNINGVDRAIKFSGGSRNEATSGVTTTNGYTIYNFIGINTIGSAASTASYEVLGCVSGGFF